MRPPVVRTLLFSTLYPSSARPLHGIFVETRLRELLRLPGVQTRVIAPVPWFPFSGSRWGSRAAFARTPAREVRNGVDVLHPRYPLLPKIGMTTAPLALALAAVPAVRRLLREGFDFDVIDAHYYYPDGVAAALLARWFGKPLVITARGSDVNVIAEHRLPRRMMVQAGRRAAALIGVSGALVERMRALGITTPSFHALRNGVDLERFSPMPRAAARSLVGQDGAPLLLSVGNLVVGKGHDVCIDALAELRRSHPAARLVVIGAGPERQRLEAHAAARGVAGCVHFAGQVQNAALHGWYAAADVLLLASAREGWPNVLLEAMACGTPVAASRVGGVPEIVGSDAAGRVVQLRDGPSFARAVTELLAGAGSDRAAVRRYAEGFGWAPTSQAQFDLFNRLAGAAR